MSTNLLKPTVALFVFIVVSLYLSFKGVFLSKITINTKATSQLSILESLYSERSLIRPEKSPKRLVLLLVDALKYSFLGFTPPENITRKNNYSSNIFTFPYKISKAQPLNALMYKAIADHPTTTSQRLKAIATGSIPTFMEIGENLGTMKVTEDSFLHQLASNGKHTIFMGDDAWTSLHNNSVYLRAFPHDSFDIFDLEGVDLTVHEHFFEQFQMNDWNILLAHCTGLDHAGHAFGGNNKEIERKLKEMNSLTSQIIQKIKNDTIFLLFGDHGMLDNGNHGGSDEDEVFTVLYAYTPGGFPSEKLKRSKEYEVFKECMYEVPYNTFKHPLNDTEDVIKQIDMVGSISRLVNVPIPYNNLGAIIPKLLMQDCYNYIDCMYDLTVEYLLNAIQTYNFIKEYVEKDMGTNRSIDEKYAEDFMNSIMKYKDDFKEIIVRQRKKSKNNMKEYIKTAIRIQTELNELLNTNSDLFRAAWAEFNPFCAYLSCIILIVIIAGPITKIVLNSAIPLKPLKLSQSIFTWKSIGLILLLLVLAFFLTPSKLFAICSLLILLGVVWKYFGSIWNANVWKFSGIGCTLIFLVIGVFRSYSLFTDSLIYYEGTFVLVSNRGVNIIP